MTQGIYISEQQRTEIRRLAAMRHADGRLVWTCAAIARGLGLNERTVSKALRDAGRTAGQEDRR